MRHMMRAIVARVYVGVAVLVAWGAPVLLAAQPACGVDRWPVKTLADRDRGSVSLTNVVPTTVRALGALDIPEVPYPNDRRLAPHELRLYRVTAIVWQIITAEDDRDWHIVLRDPVDSSSMIVEIPDPACTADPTLAARFQAARDALRRVPKRGQATFTGVGFWDFIHNQRGRARNGFELHPVLAIERL
jgi:hypothetical protein